MSSLPSADTKSLKKVLKQAKADNVPIYHMSMTSFGMVAPGSPLPPGVPASFGLLQDAYLEFTGNKPGSAWGMSRGNMKGEASYLMLYQAIENDMDAWVKFFEHEETPTFVERTCGMLGTLATILRQRGAAAASKDKLGGEENVDLVLSRTVLDLEDIVSPRHHPHIPPLPSNPALRSCSLWPSTRGRLRKWSGMAGLTLR